MKLRSDAPISCSEIGGASVVQIPLVSPDRKELEAKPAWITEKEFQRANAEINRSISRSEVERLGRTAEDGVESDALVLDEMSGEVSFLVARRNSHPR